MGSLIQGGHVIAPAIGCPASCAQRRLCHSANHSLRFSLSHEEFDYGDFYLGFHDGQFQNKGVPGKTAVVFPLPFADHNLAGIVQELRILDLVRPARTVLLLSSSAPCLTGLAHAGRTSRLYIILHTSPEGNG